MLLLRSDIIQVRSFINRRFQVFFYYRYVENTVKHVYFTSIKF